jgi:SAM-dependent methyltransferase
MLRAVEYCHHLLRSHVAPGDAAVDATAGNGHDTLLLAQLTAPGGIVFACDVQPAALAATQRRLESAGIHAGSYRLIESGHQHLAAILPPEHHGRIAAVVFNLGYLPGGDHTLTTTAATSIPAMQQALELLRPGGLIVAVLYTGHPGGAEEADAVRAFAAALPGSAWLVTEHRTLNTTRPAPGVLAIRRSTGRDRQNDGG